jgi:glyoxylase-like metal-dependent hydrolase (beta-lactamase superfamily II)
MEVAPDVLLVPDTCNVYVLRSGRDATVVDFGSGLVLDRLAELGVDRVTDVLVTHHHRDQVQGLARAVAHGARVWVPPVERDLIADVDRHWRQRLVDNDYDLRQDKFSLLEQVPVAGTVPEYRTQRFGGVDVLTLPTPGHTAGSVTYVVGGLAFVGDLLAGDGQVWSLAATQWTYSGWAGLGATFFSCGAVARAEPRLLLPSHGAPIEQPAAALARVRERVSALVDLRVDTPFDLTRWEREPWVEVTPHVLRNRTSFATSYALLSDDGAALLFDWGYDQATGVDLPNDRAAKRPLLASLERLGHRVEAVVLTHYHDDHVAGVNLLREVHGAEVWTAAHVADVLERPHELDLPCLWYDPVPVDRRLPRREPVPWHEHELTQHPLPRHTLNASAIELEVDGRRVLATGDQQTGSGGLNYQYRNRFRPHDFVRSAELYRTLRPDLFLTGHWGVVEVTDELLEKLTVDGRRLAELHEELLPRPELDVRIVPYRSTVEAGAELELEVLAPDGATVELAVPGGWEVERLEGSRFRVRAGAPTPRAVLAADVTLGDTRLGQLAEALVEVR